MGRSLSIAALLAYALAVSGCATSMTPSQFNENFPRATNSKFYDKAASNLAVSAGECKVLVENRKYTAPIGLTLSGDVKNGAVGVDEWVKADKGNSYSINSYEWITIPIKDSAATQLIVYFNTLLCKSANNEGAHNNSLKVDVPVGPPP